MTEPEKNVASVQKQRTLVNFVCKEKYLAELYPITPAAAPAWMNDAQAELPYRDQYNMPIRTIKGCAPVMDLVQSGFVVPAWTDIMVDRRRDDDGDSTQVSAGWGQERIGHFAPEQMLLTPAEGTTDYSMRVGSPWLVQTPPGYSTLILPLPYTEDHRFTPLPGIIDTDVFYKLTFVFTVPTDGRFLIEAGTPLVQLFIFQRDTFAGTVIEDADLYDDLRGRGKGAIGLGTRLAPDAYDKVRKAAE